MCCHGPVTIIPGRRGGISAEVAGPAGFIGLGIMGSAPGSHPMLRNGYLTSQVVSLDGGMHPR